MKIFKNNSNNNFEHQKKFPRTKKTDFLYKILLASKPNEQGFGLVFAFAVGFLLLILGTATIVTSGQNKTNAVVNEKANQVQAVTDSGLTRLMAFISKNPEYAEYKKDFWGSVPNSSAPAEGSYDNTSTGPLTCSGVLSINGATSSNNNSTTATNLINPNGQEINSSDYTRGAFKIEKYDLYDMTDTLITAVNATDYATLIEDLKNAANSGDTFAIAKIQIQGAASPTANNINSNFTANNRSENQLFVQVPLQKRDPNSIPFPGLWIGNQSSSSSTQNINADLMVSSCDNMSLDIEPNNSVIISNATFPDLPIAPTDDLASPSLDGVHTVDLSNVQNSSPVTLPDPSHEDENGVVDGNGIYHYLVDNIGGNGTITITPGKEVYIYLKGNMQFSGGGNIDYTCYDNSNNPIAGCEIQDFRIYAYADSTVLASNSSPFSTTPTICLSGGAASQGFIVATDYNVGVNGGSGFNFRGALWVGEWNNASTCGSNSNQIVVTQTITNWGDVAGFVPQNLPSQVGMPSNFQRQDINTINN